MNTSFLTGTLVKTIFICLIVILGFHSVLYASSRGKITGRVFDAETGQPLPGANVVIDTVLSVNTTTIEQVQVLTGGFEARYGGIQSGIVNFITRTGTRDRYTFSLNMDITPGHQKRFFGLNPWGEDSPIYQVFAGRYAMDGIQTAADSAAVSREFWWWRGWNDPSMGSYPELPSGVTLTPEEKLELWKLRHPLYSFSNKPDLYLEGSITGPLSGAVIPFLGTYAERTSFLLGFKYEETPFVYPHGPRESYIDWNTQLKLTTRITPSIRLSLDGMYARLSSLNDSRASSFGGLLDMDIPILKKYFLFFWRIHILY